MKAPEVVERLGQTLEELRSAGRSRRRGGDWRPPTGSMQWTVTSIPRPRSPPAPPRRQPAQEIHAETTQEQPLRAGRGLPGDRHPDRDATCELLEEVHGGPSVELVAAFGGARTALRGGTLAFGSRETEAPVVRPYLEVVDIEAAAKAAANGGQIAMPPRPSAEEEFAI